MHGSDDRFYGERYGATILALRDSLDTRGLTADVDADDSSSAADEFFDAGSEPRIRDANVHVLESPRPREASILLERGRAPRFDAPEGVGVGGCIEYYPATVMAVARSSP